MMKNKSLKCQIVAAAYSEQNKTKIVMKAWHLDFLLHWKNIFLEQDKHINNAAVCKSNSNYKGPGNGISTG